MDQIYFEELGLQRNDYEERLEEMRVNYEEELNYQRSLNDEMREMYESQIVE